MLQTVLVLWGVSLVTFAVIFLAGDPASAMVGEDWTRQMVDAFRHQMGFDQPWYVQYWRFLSHALRGDLGLSLRQHQPTIALVLNRLPATLELAVAATCLSIVVSLPVGILSATRRNSWLDHVAMLGALLGQSLPTFYLGLMLILVFSVTLQWTPVAGRGGLSHLILPGDHARRVHDGAQRPHHAVEPVGGAAPAVHRDRPREGGAGARRGGPARHPERADPGRHADRGGVRRAARRGRDHGDDLRLAGGRAPRRSRRSTGATCRWCRPR